MSLQNILNKINTIGTQKTNIINALNEKGANLSANAPLSSIVTAASNVTYGSGEAVTGLDYDPYWDNVVILLDMQGTPGTNSVPNRRAGTSFLTTGNDGFVLSSNQTKFGATAGYFDGTNDAVNFNSTLTLSGDFTVEAWIYMTAIDASSYTVLFSGMNTVNTQLSISSSGIPQIAIASTGYPFSTSTPVQLNRWAHVAWTRSGSTLYTFVDGVKTTGSATNSGTVQLNHLGKYYPTTSAGWEFNGFIDSVRITSGVARYTTNFTVPTQSFPTTGLSTDPYFKANSLLLKTTNVNNANNHTFVDSSSYNHTITRYGNATQGTFSPFKVQKGTEYNPAANGGSMYFDGTGDYLECPASSTTAFGTGDFTIEMWLNLNAISNQQTIMDFRVSATTIPSVINVFGPSGVFPNKITWFNGAHIPTSTLPLSANKWFHLAVSRSGNTLQIFFNGISVYSGVDNTNYTHTNKFLIGRAIDSTGYYTNGYITDLRITKGVARYTSNFTPSTSPLTADPNTVLLLNGINAGIYDATGKCNIETVGDAKVSTSIVKYGNGSMYFDGTDDMFIKGSSPSFDFGLEDFTIECWFHCGVHLGNLVSGRSAATNGVTFRVNAGKLEMFYGNGVGYYIANTSHPVNTWTHAALVRSSGIVTLYQNGINVSSATWNASINSNITRLDIGSYGSIERYTGYISDLRITKGYARYTTNFTPPDAELLLK